MIFLLWVLAVFFILLLLVAVVPIRYSLNANESDFCLRITWLFSFFRLVSTGVEKSKFYVLFFPFSVDLSKPPAKAKQLKKHVKKRVEKHVEKRVEKIKNKSVTRDVLTDTNLKRIIKPLFQAFVKILKILRPKKFRVSGVVGFPCPYETGVLFAIYEPLVSCLGIRDNLALTGDFNTDVFVFRINAKIQGSLKIWQLLTPLVTLALNKDVRKMFL